MEEKKETALLEEYDGKLVITYGQRRVTQMADKITIEVL
jgi:hypothetical protein